MDGEQFALAREIEYYGCAVETPVYDGVIQVRDSSVNGPCYRDVTRIAATRVWMKPGEIATISAHRVSTEPTP